MIKTIELFAGVGGFRMGLERANDVLTHPYQVVWSNQWEPATKTQHASLVYEACWGATNHSNESIENVPVNTIPDHDVLVGGFPCQDYSVATSLKNSKGLLGKKGVLWWSIHRILSEKEVKPKYLILENVDRLLKSPSTQRGRDFAVILKSLNDLGYAVEWRVINAADYGFPQRRRRVFFIGYHKTTNLYQNLKTSDADLWMLQTGVMAKSFPVSETVVQESVFDLEGDLLQISENFGKGLKNAPFQNSGLLLDGKIYTAKTQPAFEGERQTLKSILVAPEAVPSDYYIPSEDLDKWNYLKGAKKEIRISSSGFEYNYAEGGMIFPDPLEEPSRTIITGEGGKAPSRFKHVIATSKGWRRLVPVELERLNMFPDDHTLHPAVSDTKRAFLMGNALVVGIVTAIAKNLAQAMDS